jgi:hypothetical protein
VDNQAGFLEAFGSAFATGVPGHVNAKELHSLAHDREAGVLEDTAMLGDTAVVNRTEVGKPREIVAPDGSAMRVTARWDGDVWVEVDEDLVLETRRWREGDFLVFARTVTRDDGTLVTSKMFMGKPRRKAPVFAAPAPDASQTVKSRKSSKKAKKSRRSAEAAMDEDAGSDAGSDAESVYSHVEKAVETATGMFGGLFGGSKPTDGGSPRSNDGSSRRATASSPAALSARGAAKPRDAAAFFNLNPNASFCGSFPCSLRNHPGFLYVFEFHVGFGALNLTEHAKWHAPAKTVNNLEIVGASSLAVGLTTGLTLEFEGVDDRDAVYECMVSMLEKIPPSPGEEVHGEPDARVAAPLRLGFEQERYVFVHVVQADALPDAATGSVSIATAALGRYGAAVTAKGVTLLNAPSRFGRTLAFPAAEADLAADSVMVAVAGGGVGDAGFGAETLGEAQIPLAMLPRDRAGADEVKENPYVVSLMPPGGGFSLGGDERESPRAGGRSFRRDGESASVKARKSRAVGRLSVVAWIGTTSDLYELGSAATLAEPPAEPPRDLEGATSMAPSASVRVPPAVSRVTVNVHKVRGVSLSKPRGLLRRVDEDESISDAGDVSEEDDSEIVELKCRLTIGDQVSTTATALHSGTDQARWGPSTRQFIAMEPRGGAMRVELLRASDETCVGRVDVDISSLPMRPPKGAYARAHWLKLRAPPSDAEDASSSFGGSRSSRGGGSRSSRRSRRSKTKTTGGSGAPLGGGSFFGFNLAGPTVPAASTAVEETETEAETSDESDDESSYDDESTMNGDGGDEEYLGEILLDGFVDEGCGPTAAIGRKAPLGELSLEILSMRGVTPEGKMHRARPAVLLEMGGSWAHLPAAPAGDDQGLRRAPPAWRREIVAAAYDPADVAQIGVFDAADNNAPLGFVSVPIRRLPRGATVVSTLALSGGPSSSNESAEITIRARYTPKTSAASQLFAYLAPPLPRSAYVHGAEQSVGEGVESGVEALVRQQREYAEESLMEGPAALPASMVGAMLPRGANVRRSEKKSKLKSAKNIKACVVRIAAAIDPFHLEIEWIRRAVTWDSPIKAGLLHVALFTCVYHPAVATFVCALWCAARAAGRKRTRRWTLTGADKSPDAGSFDVGAAPPGSRLAGAETAAMLGPDAPSELASVDVGVFSALGKRSHESGENALSSSAAGVTDAGRALGVNPNAETYEFLVQVFYWTQALARHFAVHFETLHSLMTWKDTAKSHAFMTACFASAFAFLFVKWRVVVLALCFVALRHPIAGKPATAPYRLALAADP